MDNRPKSTWAHIFQAIFSFCLLCVAVFGYFHSVEPIATKARLEEHNAELERSIAGADARLKAVASEIYPFVVEQYIKRISSTFQLAYQPSLFSYGSFYFSSSEILSLEKALPTQLGIGTNPWIAAPRVEKSENASVFKIEENTKAVEVIEAHLNMPEIKFLTQEDAGRFRRAIRQFLESERFSRVLNERVSAQSVVMPGTTFDGIYQRQYREAIAGERERLKKLHTELVVAVAVLEKKLRETD